MRERLINATQSAIYAVDAVRFFETERGFHGRFYSALQQQLEQIGLLADGAILEMEHQKSHRHGLTQRPDIVFHIPAGHDNSKVKDNNFAVWALKRRASINEALTDFVLLDEMFESLRYPLGFFVNIDATDSMGQHYTGPHSDRLISVAAKQVNGEVRLHWSRPDAKA